MCLSRYQFTGKGISKINGYKCSVIKKEKVYPDGREKEGGRSRNATGRTELSVEAREESWSNTISGKEALAKSHWWQTLKDQANRLPCLPSVPR
jgi:hypothetical protein